VKIGKMIFQANAILKQASLAIFDKADIKPKLVKCIKKIHINKGGTIKRMQ
jgi:hypothetical protein